MAVHCHQVPSNRIPVFLFLHSVMIFIIYLFITVYIIINYQTRDMGAST